MWTTIILYAMIVINTDKGFVSGIIGGQVLRENEAPWLFLLSATYVSVEDNKSHVRNCGATLIHEEWLVTEAHCFIYGNGKRIPADKWIASFKARTVGRSIYDFRHDIYNFIKTGRQYIKKQTTIEKIILHPQFNLTSYFNDIALVKLPLISVKFKLNVETLRLPMVNDDCLSHIVCRTYGWGCTDYGWDLSRKATKAMLPVVLRNKCSLLKGGKQRDNICAGKTDGSIVLCKGDSGSPLVCGIKGQQLLIGISSYVSSNYPRHFLTVFIRVSSYLDWIRSETLRGLS